MSLDGKIKNERCVKYTHMFMLHRNHRHSVSTNKRDAHTNSKNCSCAHRARATTLPRRTRGAETQTTRHIYESQLTRKAPPRERRREAAAARGRTVHRRPQHAALQHAAPRTCTAAHRAHHTTARGRRPSTYRYTRGDPRSQGRRGSRTPIAIVHAHACFHGTRTSHRRHTSHTWPTS